MKPFTAFPAPARGDLAIGRRPHPPLPRTVRPAIRKEAKRTAERAEAIFVTAGVFVLAFGITLAWLLQ